MRVAVIGGGVIGLCAAHYLERRGAEVVLLERDAVGGGCSKGNGGWVCPSISRPLPAPGLTLTSLRWMLRSDSPLYIKPSAMPRLMGWLWAFRRHCNAESYRAGVTALAALNAATDRLYRGLAEEGMAFERAESGTILAYDDERELGQTQALLARLGEERVGPVEVLDRDALAEAEPDLRGGLIGLRVRDDAHVRPESLCAELAASLEARGVEIRTGERVVGFTRKGDRVRAAIAWAARSGSAAHGRPARIGADAFVLAAGAETSVLAEPLGAKLPVQAGKGYSITVGNARVRLSQPLHVTPARIGFTPFRGAVRTIGTMEFSGINLRLDRRRIAILERAARRYLPGALEGTERADWVGMRPVTPDGLPAVGRLPDLPNVYVATGHQMLGVTLAPSTGHALAQLMLEGRSDIELAPFDPARLA
ncbi:NAD(P)/FAD-dependent oxidoreductase [Candidatus Palauibacter irciniicola]|uniref:NAD(P)/FAD-dependent oxidoreductase n=1 Tax=Candidatus Palauibacter irciniicola TaxID=3056733 RepID=UPI003B02A96A